MVQFIGVQVDVGGREALFVVLCRHPDDAVIIALLFTDLRNILLRPQLTVSAPVACPAVFAPRVATLDQPDVVAEFFDTNHGVCVALNESLIVFF